MSERGGEPFAMAYGEMRRRLLAGAYPPETRLAATELAAELRLSATPMREALSRLAGEGLLDDRRGLGFFIRRLSRRDVAMLYRLQLAHLLLVLDRLAAAPPGEPAAACPVVRTETLFAAWAAAAGAPALTASLRRIQAQLSPVRRLEPQLFDDLDDEAAALGQLTSAGERARALRRFHQRRARVAERLSELLERPRGIVPI